MKLIVQLTTVPKLLVYNIIVETLTRSPISINSFCGSGCFGLLERGAPSVLGVLIVDYQGADPRDDHLAEIDFFRG